MKAIFCIGLGCLGWAIVGQSALMAQLSTRWQGMGRGLSSPYIETIVPMGEDVYVGGMFERAGNTQAKMIARWNWSNQQWYALGTSVNSNVFAVEPVIWGGDTLLFVGGTFQSAGGQPCHGLALWNPRTQQWEGIISRLVSGRTVGPRIMGILQVGDSVIVHGYFLGIDDIPATGVAMYNLRTRSWQALGNFEQRADTSLGEPIITKAVKVNEELYVIGVFTHVDGIYTDQIARYNFRTQRWDSVPGNPFRLSRTETVRAYCIASHGDSLVIGGSFQIPLGGSVARALVVYNMRTKQWHDLGGGVWRDTATSSVKYFAVFALATDGKRLYVGGSFDTAGTIPARNIAVYDFKSAQWDTLESGVTGRVTSLALDASRLYVGGGFLYAGSDSLRVNYIAAWQLDTTTIGVREHGMRSPRVYVVGNQIRFSVPEAGWVQVRLFDSKGGMVGVLYRGWCQVGEYAVELPEVATGMYVVQLGMQSYNVAAPVIIQR